MRKGRNEENRVFGFEEENVGRDKAFPRPFGSGHQA